MWSNSKVLDTQCSISLMLADFMNILQTKPLENVWEQTKLAASNIKENVKLHCWILTSVLLFFHLQVVRYLM
jgi:hypothetical protein